MSRLCHPWAKHSDRSLSPSFYFFFILFVLVYIYSRANIVKCRLKNSQSGVCAGGRGLFLARSTGKSWNLWLRALVLGVECQKFFDSRGGEKFFFLSLPVVVIFLFVSCCAFIFIFRTFTADKVRLRFGTGGKNNDQHRLVFFFLFLVALFLFLHCAKVFENLSFYIFCDENFGLCQKCV